MRAMSVVSPRIQLLPDHLINQIAAGEVIERPASVVKELIENSLDAGATQLDIEIEQGGRRLIRVRDNGLGISRDELPLALCRHATSKIQRLEDLEVVSSLGFRGEALASIAAVSRLEICSRASGADTGWRLQRPVINGTADGEPVAHPVGTSISVHELFYNTPARRKFLRTEQTEYQHILELVKRLALSCYGTGIRLSHNQRQVLKLSPVSDAVSEMLRVKKILGTGFSDRALSISEAVDGLQLNGWLGHPDVARSQSDMQYFFLNGRMIRDKRINHAIRLAFDETLYPGRFPSYLLYLQIAPAEVDVNVHPAKSEVRFRDSRRVHDFIACALRQCLMGQQAIDLPVSTPAQTASPGSPSRPPARPAYGTRQHRQSQVFYASAASARDTAGQIADAPRAELKSLGQAVSCLEGRFILSALEGRYCLTNIGLACQLLAAQILRQGYASQKVHSQPLLMPASLLIKPHQVEALAARLQTFQRLGVEVDLVGDETAILRAMPAVLRGADMKQAFAALLEVVEQLTGEETDGGVAERLIQAMLAHVCAGPEDLRSREGMETLLRRIEKSDLINTHQGEAFFRYFRADDLQAFISQDV